MRNAVPMRAGCRAWIKDGKEAQEEAQRRALRERGMPWKTLWIRCGLQPLGTEKHDPGQQVLVTGTMPPLNSPNRLPIAPIDLSPVLSNAGFIPRVCRAYTRRDRKIH